VPSKNGGEELISRNAAAHAIGYTPKMLRNWIKDYDKIKASSKGSRKANCTQPAKEPQIEAQLYDLIIEKCAIGRRVGRRWLEQHAKVIYSNLYPNRVMRIKGECVIYKGFQFSDR
jgi:hypothetical protein